MKTKNEGLLEILIGVGIGIVLFIFVVIAAVIMFRELVNL